MPLPKAITKILSKVLPVPKEYERPVLFIRRHPLTFVPALALTLILLAIPLIGYWFATDTVLNLWSTEAGRAALTMAGSAWYLFVLLLFFTQFVDFFLDVWIVTNERLIDILQQGLFARIIKEARLYRVQNVRIETRGVFQTFFHFGDIIVETAAGEGRLHLDNIPHPDVVARKILELAQADREYHAEKIKMERLEEGARIVDSGA